MDELQLPLLETSHYEVGNGVALKGKRICKSVIVVLLNVTIKENFPPLELSRVDVILGMVWLCNMGIWR